jgi:hypothetical protein
MARPRPEPEPPAAAAAETPRTATCPECGKEFEPPPGMIAGSPCWECAWMFVDLVRRGIIPAKL